MTIEEAQSKARLLSDINLKIWQAKTSVERESLRAAFKENANAIIADGYRILRSKVLDPSLGYRVPMFKIRLDKSHDCVSIVNNRAAGGHHRGDCTTRCIAFCTGEDYLTIQKEQMENAAKAGYGKTWRSMSVWSLSLLRRGYCEIDLPRHVSRKVFLRLFKDCGIDEGIIATHSSGHVAAIDMKSKKILDLYNSAGGRIIRIFVPVWQKMLWTRKVNAILG